MKLYYAPRTISVAVAIALNEAGLAHDLHKLDFAAGEQTRPDYHRINPKGRVPALQTDTGILTETGAILEYIAAIAPEADLMPAAPEDAARVRAVMYYLASTMHVNHAHNTRAYRWADQPASHADMKAKVAQNMTDSARHIDGDCLTGPFVMGARPCIADFYLFVVCSWLEGDGVDVSAFPRIVAFRAAMEARPSVQAARKAGLL